MPDSTVLQRRESFSRNLRVLLLQPPRPEAVDKEYLATQIPINLCYLAAVLEKAQAEVRIIDYFVDDYTAELLTNELRDFRPDIVGIGSFTSSIKYVEPIARTVKLFNPRIVTLLGGVHLSALPQQTMPDVPSIDLGVVGEGEETLKEIYLAIKNGLPLCDIDGICYREDGRTVLTPRRALIENLDDIPFPARHLVPLEKYKRAHVSRGFSRKYLNIMELFTSRGCPNKCIFCAGHVNYGFKLRYRSFENIRAEILLLREQYGIDHITFDDDTLTINRDLVVQVSSLLKEYNITFDCNARVNTVDYELLKHMKNCGCKKVSFGVESGSPRMLKLLKKGITVEQVKHAFRMAKKAGIKYIEGTFMMGGHPDETLEDVEMTRKLMFELMPDFISMSIIIPFPGTETCNLMVQRGLLSEKPDWANYTFNVHKKLPFERLTYLTASQLIALQAHIIKSYYMNPVYLLRKVLGIRSLRDLAYFVKLGRQFFSLFMLKKN